MSQIAVTDRLPDLTAGLCRERPDAFENINTLTSHRATQICLSGCPVFDTCRDWGVRHEVYGCWGGLADRALAAERKRLGVELVELRTGEIAPRVKARRGAQT